MMKSKLIESHSFIFWDFDGVILNSMNVRDEGFVKVLTHYSQDIIDQFLSYHRENGGLSRYHKFRYLFNEILKVPFSENQINELANTFSLIMKESLTDKNLLINETINFIRDTQEDIDHVIVSGSDQTELRYLCKELKITSLFKGIYGSPTPKNTLVELLIPLEQLNKTQTCLIGDSRNDLEAATKNKIAFYGFNYTGKEKVEELDFLT